MSDGVSTFKANPYGQRSLQLTDSAYRTFAAPFLPYIARPLQYVTPYLKKADDLGDKTLRTLDEKLPIVKKPTNEIINDAKTLVLLPFRIGQSGREHVLNTYDSEYKKVEGNNNLVRGGKAVLTTTLILTTDTVNTISSFLGAKKTEARRTVEEKSSN